MPAIKIFFATCCALSLSAQSATEAIQAFHQGRYVEARQMLEKLVAASPDDGTARTFLALSRAATGDCGSAADDLQRQFNSNPDPQLRRFAGVALVQCALARNRLQDAFPVLDKLQKSFP